MTYFQSTILGIIQGASEFLPISSSGHLVLAPYLFGWNIDPQEAFIFDVLVQVATLSAVIIFYWNDLIDIWSSFFSGILAGNPFQNQPARMGWYLVISTVPAGLAAIFFKDTFQDAFSNPKFAAIFLLATSALLILGEFIGSQTKIIDSLNWTDALLIGFFQVLALFPGISRSGSTISGGLIRNLDRKTAARYSFLMAVPVMLAAGVLAGYDLFRSPILLDNLSVYFVGFAVSAVVGYLAIRWFINYLTSKSLFVFAVYCAAVGAGFLISMSF